MNKGIPLGYNQFRKTSTLIQSLQDSNFDLSMEQLPESLNYSLMNKLPDIISSFWKENNIEPLQFLDIVTLFPEFTYFMNDKCSDPLHQASNQEDTTHGAVPRNVLRKTYQYSFANFVNYCFYVWPNRPWKSLSKEELKMEFKYEFFQTSAIQAWSIWLGDLNYKCTSRKIMVNGLCAIVQFLILHMAKHYSSQYISELQSCAIVLQNHMSSLQILCDKYYQERNIKENLEKDDIYLSQTEFISSFSTCKQSMDTVILNVESFFKQEFGANSKWQDYEISDCSESTQNQIYDYLMTKIGTRIKGYRFFAYQKAIMYCLNVWCSPQRTENFASLKTGAFKQENSGWIFYKKNVEKQDKMNSRRVHKNTTYSRIIPMMSDCNNYLTMWLNWIHPLLVEKNSPKKNAGSGPKNYCMTWMWLSPNGKEFSVTDKFWRETMYEITLELIGKAFHQRWIRNRFGDLLACFCITINDWLTLCQYMSHSLEVHRKYYFATSRISLRNGFTTVVERLLQESAVKNTLEYEVPSNMSEQDQLLLKDKLKATLEAELVAWNTRRQNSLVVQSIIQSANQVPSIATLLQPAFQVPSTSNPIATTSEISQPPVIPIRTSIFKNAMVICVDSDDDEDGDDVAEDDEPPMKKRRI